MITCWHDWLIKESAPSRLTWAMDYDKATGQLKTDFPAFQTAGLIAFFGVIPAYLCYHLCYLIAGWPLLITVPLMGIILCIATLALIEPQIEKWFGIYDRVCLNCHEVRLDATAIIAKRNKAKEKLVQKAALKMDRKLQEEKRQKRREDEATHSFNVYKSHQLKLD